MSALEFKLHDVYVKSALLNRFYKVRHIQQLRSYNKDIYLYRSNSPYAIPMNTDMVILNEEREMVRPHIIRVGEYHPLLGKRLA